jgi:hypothetical protein
MTKQEKQELQHLKERIAYLEGILFTLQGQKTVPVVIPTVSPQFNWYDPYPTYKVTC